MGIGSFINKLRPADEKEQQSLELVEKYVDKKRFKLIKDLLKDKKISIEIFELSSIIAEGIEMPQIKSEDDEVDAADVNKDIAKKAMKEVFSKFSKKAFDIIPQLIAPNIQGMEEVKKVAALQLFSQQPVHILLLGDPGTGKTDILRSVQKMSPISSFGLGSGTSGVGLVATVKGSEVMKGLLPMADNGICCIDELNLMKDDSRAGMYNAMEKGFVTYDKGGKHFKFDARVKILATANPKGDKFTGKNLEELKEEIPFDSALLTRFHTIFFVRKPDIKKFKQIAEKIASQQKTELSEGDIEIIKAYIDYTMSLDVADIPKSLQEKVVEFVTDLKKNEGKYLIEISPRQLIGIMRLCKALARMEARDVPEEKDLERIKEIFKESLKIEMSKAR